MATNTFRRLDFLTPSRRCPQVNFLRTSYTTAEANGTVAVEVGCEGDCAELQCSFLTVSWRAG